jgi:hypothetical protein
MSQTCSRGFGTLAVALVMLALAGQAAAGHSIAERIEELWADDERPGAGEACRMYVVRAAPPILRGSASGRGCVVRAITAAREDDRNLAIHWLMAGYCRNEDARREIDQSGEEALSYAIRTYGPKVP